MSHYRSRWDGSGTPGVFCCADIPLMGHSKPMSCTLPRDHTLPHEAWKDGIPKHDGTRGCWAVWDLSYRAKDSCSARLTESFVILQFRGTLPSPAPFQSPPIFSSCSTAHESEGVEVGVPSVPQVPPPQPNFARCARCREEERIPTFQFVKFDDAVQYLCEGCWQIFRRWFFVGKRNSEEESPF